MIFVIETLAGRVKQVKPFNDDQDFASELFARELCKVNGIVYEGAISCDGSPKRYSVQVFRNDELTIAEAKINGIVDALHANGYSTASIYQRLIIEHDVSPQDAKAATNFDPDD